MKNIEGILVPVDFSENSLNALQFAMELAKKSNAKIFALHTYRLIQPSSDHAFAKGSSLKEELEKAALKKFDEVEKKYFRESRIKYEFLLEIGFTAGVIESILDTYSIDIIVMGTSGTTGMKDLLGSTTSTIVKRVKTPVFVIPAEADFKGIRKITFASDYQEPDQPDSLKVVALFAKLFNANIEVLSINTAVSVTSLEEEGKLLYDDYFKGMKLSYHFRTTKDIEEGIIDHLNKNETDVLVMVTKGHNFLERIFNKSITRSMVLHTHIPLLAISV